MLQHAAASPFRSRCAAQMAERPVSSARMWKSHASVVSITARLSAAPSNSVVLP
jgi:hypothetical protein